MNRPTPGHPPGTQPGKSVCDAAGRTALPVKASGSAMQKVTVLPEEPSDVLVLFGATRDLAVKKLRPALFRMYRTGRGGAGESGKREQR